MSRRRHRNCESGTEHEMFHRASPCESDGAAAAAHVNRPLLLLVVAITAALMLTSVLTALPAMFAGALVGVV
jgi:hypothetical protein